MGPLWHEPFAQALNHDENYACPCANDFGGRFKTLLHSPPEHNASVNKWVR